MAPTAARRAEQHAEIDWRYKWAAKAARDRPAQRRFSLAGRRVNELNLIFNDRYGPILPDDDAGADDIALMAHALARAHRNIRLWIELRAPWMRRDQADEIIERVMANPLKFRATTLGARLGLTEAERSRLGITTIASIDVSPEERQLQRKRRRCQRDRARRRARGATPRAEYLEANGTSRAKPWLAEGISRRTWYRRRERLTGNEDESIQWDTTISPQRANAR